MGNRSVICTVGEIGSNGIGIMQGQETACIIGVRMHISPVIALRKICAVAFQHADQSPGTPVRLYISVVLTFVKLRFQIILLSEHANQTTHISITLVDAGDGCIIYYIGKSFRRNRLSDNTAGAAVVTAASLLYGPVFSRSQIMF